VDNAMIFVDGLVQVESIKTTEQAEAVVEFLRGEVLRHVRAQDSAAKCADYHRAKALMYQSAVDRHAPDIEGTNKKIAVVCEMWRLEA